MAGGEVPSANGRVPADDAGADPVTPAHLLGP